MSAEDLGAIVALGADERVMAPLGGTLPPEKSAGWMEAQLRHWQVFGFGRFVLERDDLFVGLVGLSRTDFDAGVVPAIEVAWRLVFDHWGKGYATEGARPVVRDGFERVGLSEIVGVTTPGNVASRRVMDRLGMVWSPRETFDHPRLPEGDPLRQHVVYRLSR